ncbi:hypothetical protein [Nitrosomonas sp. Nm166]|uniref:hypothetical protein n=1 Tax=Nitrosomonas sp. Nm166 TaxID=1881054 RepID=UPI0008F105F0|nr:hypothetical protein [Nitrosomonas sp. Nm166]SFF10420.1 hypothetical protein SAMN05428977_105019 [Nitrosomonas sp. Nm166]
MMKINVLSLNVFLSFLIMSNFIFAESAPVQERLNKKQNPVEPSFEEPVSKEKNRDEKALPPKTEKQGLNHNSGKSPPDKIHPRVNFNSPPGVNN